MANIAVEVRNRETGEVSIIPISTQDEVPPRMLREVYEPTGRWWRRERRPVRGPNGYRTHSAHIRL